MMPTNTDQLLVEMRDPPDRLLGAILRSLSRPLPVSRPWGIVRTLLGALISFGFLPLWIGIKRQRNLAAAAEQQLWHVGEWLRLQQGQSAGEHLQRAAAKLRSGRIWLTAALLISILLPIYLLAFWLGQPLMRDPMRHYAMQDGHALPGELPAIMRQMGNWYWNGGLLLAYLLLWMAIKMFERRLFDFLRHFNDATRTWDAPVQLPAARRGLGPLWMLTALMLLLGGGWLWGLGMMLAGALHKQTIRLTYEQARLGLLQSLRRLQSLWHPRGSWAVHCARLRCGAWLPAAARFCPRCGKPTGQWMPLSMQQV